MLIDELWKRDHQQARIADKTYFSTIGSILNNAKDWDGHRLLRRKRPVAEGEQWQNFYVSDNQMLYMDEEIIDPKI